MSPGEPCPLCKTADSRLLYQGRVVLRRCASCRAVFNTAYAPADYDDTYFNEEYRTQYGKTYLEDYDAIYSLSLSRLRRITALLPPSTAGPGRLLDVGCAWGFFLKAARDMGFNDVTGVEISSTAARYCGETLGIPVIRAAFDDASPAPPFRVITAWYFLEHLPDTGTALERLTGLLEPGGILAFSMPSILGPQYLFHRREWYESHPGDHRINLSPGIAAKALKSLGFHRIVTAPGGIHPHRFLPSAIAGLAPARILYRAVSRILSFSDTMEVYAVKK